MFLPFNVELDDYSANPERFADNICSILKITRKQADEHGLTKEDLFFKFFLNNIEPGLGFDHPAIVYEYPVEMASLSRKCPDNELYAERFELYIFGIEFANAFGELTDPADQEARFLKDLEVRQKKAIYKLELPARFLKSLKYGLPPCAGIALGLERLFMLFEGLGSLEETNLF